MRCRTNRFGRNHGTIKSSHERGLNVPFVWIEKEYNSEIDIREFLNHDGALNKDAMQRAIKEELKQSYQKTSQWQKTAILKAFPTD